ncbi:hypothetical protein QR680_016418 [Steinernema hermaphroditum]|uniref:7TM GPCR serpentine receptor class x (Srx) domain-containing protein n=1 Tax=Steinernema hermaphroditum TaxID=289476 RepID=A0AA39HBH4_9BILA|nr:hypothetical protein QR680_016418 [Steinernema hermaphroditum]
MELYVLRHDEYLRLYNCSYMSGKEWFDHGIPDPFFGILTFAIGVVLNVAYVPCLITMFNSRVLMKWSAYKLMFYIGINDIVLLDMNSYFTGYYSIIGAVGCPGVDIKYIFGTLGMVAWTSQSVSILMLALNRCIDLWQPRYLSKVFDGKRTYYWIGASVIYSLYFLLFVPGVIFSLHGYAWFFDPYLDIEEMKFVDKSKFIYFLYARSGEEDTKDRQVYDEPKLCFCAFVYFYMQLVPVSVLLSKSATLTLQLSNGAPPVVYLLVNRTIREGVLAMLPFKVSFSTNAHPMPSYTTRTGAVLPTFHISKH